MIYYVQDLEFEGQREETHILIYCIICFDWLLHELITPKTTH